MVATDLISNEPTMVRPASNSFQGSPCVNFSELNTTAGGGEGRHGFRDSVEKGTGESGRVHRACSRINAIAEIKHSDYEQARPCLDDRMSRCIAQGCDVLCIVLSCQD